MGDFKTENSRTLQINNDCNKPMDNNQSETHKEVDDLEETYEEFDDLEDENKHRETASTAPASDNGVNKCGSNNYRIYLLNPTTN